MKDKGYVKFGGGGGAQIRCTMENFVAKRAFSPTWATSMLIYWNKRKRLLKRRVQDKGYLKFGGGGVGANKVHYGKFCGGKTVFTHVARIYANLLEQKKAFA